MRLTLALFTALALSLPAQAQEGASPAPHLNDAAVPEVLARTVDSFIRPGYHRFLDAAKAMEAGMTELCVAPGQQTLAAARTAFADTVKAWSRIEIIRVGPVLEKNRFERILFYPDRKSIGLKQVQAALAEEDPSATSVATLQGKSVAMQGLGALEFILHGTGSEELASEAADYRCLYGHAIAGNLTMLGTELAAAWDKPDGIQAAWKAPGPDNPVFRNENEAATALLGILVHGMEAVRDQRVETFYKGTDARSLPKQAIYWRSGLTWASVSANVEGLQTLARTADVQQLLDPEQRWIIGTIDFLMTSVRRVAETIDTDIEKAVESLEQRDKLDYVLINTKDLILRLSNDFGGAIGLGAGFSFSDGD